MCFVFRKAVGFFLCLLLLAIQAPVCEAKDSNELCLAWLLQSEGRLKMVFYNNREVGREWIPNGQSSGSFDLKSVRELWLIYSEYKARAFVIAGEVTSIKAWSKVSGKEIPPALLPSPPKALKEAFIWPAEQQEFKEKDSYAERVKEILARELDDLGLDPSILKEDEGEEGLEDFELTPLVEDKLTRSLKTGFTFDESEQLNSSPKLVSTTRNIYLEYTLDYSHYSDEVERSMNAQASLGSTFDEVTIDYGLARPAAALEQLSASVNANFERDKSSGSYASDTFIWGINGEATKNLSDELELLTNIEIDGTDYLSKDDLLFDSRQWNGEVLVKHYDRYLEIALGLLLENRTYPRDEPSNYDERAAEVLAYGMSGRLSWDFSYQKGLHSFENGDSESAQTGTTNDDYSFQDIQVVSEWSFNESLVSEFSFSLYEQDYDNPDETNFDFSSIEFGPSLDWNMGSGWSSSFSVNWLRERYVDQDGDDADPGSVIEESLENLDTRSYELSFMYTEEKLDLYFGGTIGRDSYPNSPESIFASNVDARRNSLDFSLLWRFSNSWSFEFLASRWTEDYPIRPEDNTRADSLSASVKREF